MREHVVSLKNQLRSILLMLALMALTIIIILKEYSIWKIAAAIKSIHPFYLFAGIGLMFLYAACQAMNIFLIMQRLGQASSYKNCLEYAFIGNYFGAITPGASGGQPAQVYYMNKDKIRIDLSVLALFYTVFVSQIVILLMGGVLAYLRYRAVLKLARWFIYLLFAGTMVMLGLILILLALMFSRRVVPFLLHAGINFLGKIHVIKQPEVIKAKSEKQIKDYYEKSKIILKHPDLFIQVFFVTILQWVSYCMVCYLVYLSFGFRDYDILDLMTGQALINIAVAAAPLPGSVGVAEKAALNVFGQFYPITDLPSAMLLNRIINFYLPLLISFTVYLFTHHRIRKELK